jgi:hypothetical protein
MWRLYAPTKHLAISELHGTETQKSVHFIETTVIVSDPEKNIPWLLKVGLPYVRD